MKNIYFFDIDNTLLDHNTQAIPQSALTAIEKLQHAGNTVVIATGRCFEHAKPFIDQIQPSYAITQNGARIYQGEQAVFGKPLAREALIDLLSWVNDQGHHFGFNVGKIGYLSKIIPTTVEPLGIVGIEARLDIGLYRQQDIYQAWLFFDESLDATLMPIILQQHPEFDIVRWHKMAVDVLNKSVNKWTGCQWVMAQTGFKSEQAIAFGDGLNDMEMLQGVGLGIAMDNGHPILKSVANRIAPALHLDGIASMLEELALMQ